MGRRAVDAAEASFFMALCTTAPLIKRAVDLDPATATALGVDGVAPAELQAIEQSGSETETVRDDDLADQYQAAPAQTAGVDLQAFDRRDAEPADAEPTVEPELPSRLTHGKLFSDKRSHPLQIFDVLNMRYAEAWVDWEPETLWWALRRDFGTVGEVNRNKIMALRLAAVTDTPWLDWDTFENSTLAWNDIVPLFGTYQPVTPAQAAFGVHVLQAIRSDEPFAWEVKAYIAAGLEDEGFVYAPDEWFAGAQAVIDRKQWLQGFRAKVISAWTKVQDVDPTQVDWDESDPLQVHLVKLAVVKKYLIERAALRVKVPSPSRSLGPVSPPVPA